MIAAMTSLAAFRAGYQEAFDGLSGRRGRYDSSFQFSIMAP